MQRVAPISWQKFEKFLLSIGCNFERQKGDHLIYSKKGLKRPVVIPKEKELPIFIIRNNLRTLNFTTEEYLKILKNI